LISEATSEDYSSFDTS